MASTLVQSMDGEAPGTRIGRVVAKFRRMPNSTTKRRAAAAKAEGKSGSTQAGEFIREEMHHIREGKHGARNAKQAIAIGLSKARRSGVDVEPGPKASQRVRRKAAQDTARAGKKPNPRRSRASTAAAKREPHSAASHLALSRQAKASAERRRKQGGPRSPTAVAERAARTRKRTKKTSSKRATPRARAA